MTTDLQRKRDEALYQIELDGGTSPFNKRDAEMAFRAGFLLACEMISEQLNVPICDNEDECVYCKIDALREQGEKEL